MESLNKYQALLAEGKSEKEALVVLLAGSRDHSRIVMAWDNSPHGGFSTAEPWIRQDALYQDVNVAAQRDDVTSVWRFTQDLIRLRRRIPGFAYADIRFLEEARKDYFCWERVAGVKQGGSESADLAAGADAGANESTAIANDESAAKGTAQGAAKGAEKVTAKGTGTSACTIRVEMNLSAERKALPTLKNANAQLVLCNYPHEEAPNVFEPYEVRIWQY